MEKRFTFGIYPGGIAGTDSAAELTAGKPDNPGEINRALDILQPSGSEFWIRCYTAYYGNGVSKNNNPDNPLQYARHGRKLDMVIGYHSMLGDIDLFTKFVRQQVRHYGDALAKVQIAEEPNLHGVPVIDGDIPNVREALIRGVVAAKEEARLLNLNILTGFNAVPNFNPDDDFWKEMRAKATCTFNNSLDYVGLDFFPDVFRPAPFENIEGGIKALLGHFRNVNLKEAGISSTVPVHITENGWPTSDERPEEKQSMVIEKVIRTVYDERENSNIGGYELFSLRDSDSKNPDIFCRFGIMRDDYSPKPAFNTFKSLITELGQ
jgi:hypothetical protein